MRIAHASIDENRNTKNGQAGNQNGREVCVRTWYNKPWTVCLRHPDRYVREQIADIAEMLATPPVNSLIGYDQNERNSLHNVAKSCKYDIMEFINAHELCETDCSAFVTCVCLFAGLKQLEYSGNAPTTSTMKATFKKAGFNVLTDEKYVSMTDYLSKGDILLKPSGHTVIVLDDGDKYGSIVDALKTIGVDSSKDNRRKIYKANFPDKYNGTGKQNRDMLELLKAGRLVKP